jgi:Tol biopolymer transport system component
MKDDLPPDRDAALAALFRLQAASLLRLAALLVGEEAAAQDVLLQAFADLRMRCRDSFEAINALRAAVVRNSRRCERGPAGALAALTRAQREAFVLRWELGLSAQEIGALLRRWPRSVVRTLDEARRKLPPDEELAEAVEPQAAAAQLSYDAWDELRDRRSAVRADRRRGVGVGLAVAALAVGAVVAIGWTTRPRPYASPTGRPIFAAVVPGAELATFDVRTGKPRGDVQVAGVQAVASLPAGGWLVARMGTGCSSTLTVIRPDGSAARVGQPQLALLSDLEVSPDGRYVAGVTSLCLNPRVLGIDVIDVRTGRLLSAWRPPQRTTSITGLSWAPDSRRLAYTLGSGVGGRGSGYGLLDTRGSGGRLAPTDPSAREVVLDGQPCQVVRSIWLGRTGRFAVFAGCLAGNRLVLVDVAPEPGSAPHGAVLATVPDSALTLGLDAAATDDGRHLLVTTDVATYRIDGSRVTRLVDTRSAPAW